jgi:hypothetical protein
MYSNEKEPRNDPVRLTATQIFVQTNRTFKLTAQVTLDRCSTQTTLTKLEREQKYSLQPSSNTLQTKTFTAINKMDDRMIGIRMSVGTGARCRWGLGPTQPPIQWVPGALSLGTESCRGVKLTTHLHLVPRSKNEWSYMSTLPIRPHGVLPS